MRLRPRSASTLGNCNDLGTTRVTSFLFYIRTLVVKASIGSLISVRSLSVWPLARCLQESPPRPAYYMGTAIRRMRGR